MATWGSPEYQRLVELLRLYLRPATVAVDAAENATLTFDPVLSAAEQATFADLQAMARSRQTADMTLAEYQAVKPFLASEAAWMAITRNAFVNMAEADMRRAVYDIVTAEVRLARAARRDA